MEFVDRDERVSRNASFLPLNIYLQHIGVSGNSYWLGGRLFKIYGLSGNPCQTALTTASASRNWIYIFFSGNCQNAIHLPFSVGGGRKPQMSKKSNPEGMKRHTNSITSDYIYINQSCFLFPSPALYDTLPIRLNSQCTDEAGGGGRGFGWSWRGYGWSGSLAASLP